MRTIVYTAIFGDKDFLKEPKNHVNQENVDFYCFTDDKSLSSENYNIRVVDSPNLDITKNARKLKIIGFSGIENYDVAIWHDASLRIDSSRIPDLIKCLNIEDIATFKHPYRKCLYAEAIEVIKLNKDYPLRVLNLVVIFFFKGYPINAGLYETSILVKNVKSKRLAAFLKCWWFWVENYSRRDQLSFNFCLKKNNIKLNHLSGSRDNNNYSDHEYHLYSYYMDKAKRPFSQSTILKRLSIKLIKLMRRIATGL